MKHISAFDYARGIAIICVVMGHNLVVYADNPVQFFPEIFVLIPCAVSVPLFFFISSYLLAGKHEGKFLPFIQGKFLRIYLPCLIWTVIIWLVASLMQSNFDVPTLIKNLAILREPYPYYFSFVLMLFFVFLFFVVDLDPKTLKKLVWASFFVNLLAIIACEYIFWNNPYLPFSPTLLYRNPFAWIFFLMYGAYVRRTDPTMSKGLFKYLIDYKVIVIPAIVGTWLLSALEYWVLCTRNMGDSGFFRIPGFFFEILAIVYVIHLVKKIKDNQPVAKVLSVLGKYSFFIYLVHVPLLPMLLPPHRIITSRAIYYPYMITMIILELTLPIVFASLIVRFSHIDIVYRIGIGLGVPVKRAAQPQRKPAEVETPALKQA